MKAAKAGSAVCVTALLKAQANPDIRTPVFGNSALLSAVVSGSADCTRALLSANAKVNIRDADGNTPLIAATVSGQIVCVELLIKYHADLEAKAWAKTTEPSNGFSTPPFYGTALAYAASAGNTAIVKILLEAGAKPHAAVVQAQKGSLGRVGG